MLPETIVAQALLLIAVIAAVALTKSASRTEAAARLLAGWSVFLGLALAGVWFAPPPIGLRIFGVLLAAASALHLYRTQSGTNPRWLRLSHTPTLASLALGSLLLWQGIGGRAQPSAAVVDLAAPMATDGAVCVMSGGSSLALNAHRLSGGSPSGVQEIHSIDFIRLREGSFRTHDWHWETQPSDIAAYLIHDEPVFAPCAGTVQGAKNDHPDHPAGGEHRDPTGTNFVTLRCEDTDIILAHLKQGSVTVEAGQEVDVGDLLGTIGNSGNTEEPHLHIQAQSVLPPDSDQQYPSPVVMTFDGRYLSRGECL